MDIAQADYASATFKALIIQGFLRFWGMESHPWEWFELSALVKLSLIDGFRQGSKPMVNPLSDTALGVPQQ